MKTQPVAAPSGTPICVSWASPSAQIAEEEAGVGGTSRASEAAPNTLERAAFTVPEFCYRNNISRPTYQRLRAQGRGPAEMRLGLNTIRITAKAERDWQEMMQKPRADLEERAADRAVKAGEAAIKSDAHVSNRTRKQRELSRNNSNRRA
jgi:hypothetical protein